MVGPIAEKSVWFFITLFSAFVSITQFFDFWVMSYGNWKHILGVLGFHNSVFNGIFINNITYVVPLSDSATTFDPLFFFSSLGSVHAVSSFFFFSFHTRWLLLLLSLRAVSGFFFFLLLSLGSVKGFWGFFFHWVWGVWVLGVEEKKKSKSCTKSTHKQLKNIEWWQVSNGAKWGGVF